MMLHGRSKLGSFLLKAFLHQVQVSETELRLKALNIFLLHPCVVSERSVCHLRLIMV
jgi:hypothetical protein